MKGESKMFKYKESDILIIISALKKIIAIFLGPFLTVYFIKISTESLIALSLYNVMNYIFLGLGGIIIGWIVRNKFQVGMFRVGVIINFIYVLFIIILKEKILNYLPLISFLYGFSSIAYYYPYNLFVASKVNNIERTNYEFKKQTISTLTAILTPIIIGGIITTTNFQLTAIIILFASIIQIILSFFVSPIQDKNYKFTPLSSLKYFLRNNDVKNMFISDYFKGMTVSEGVLEVVLTILVFSAFKTDLNLGILSTISSILVIAIQYLYTKKLKNKRNKFVIILCSIIPTLSLLLLLIFTNNITLIVYYLCYGTFVNLLSFISSVRLFNISNSMEIKTEHNIEFWSIREIILNVGRISGYLLLLLITKINKFNYLYYLMVLLTLSIPLMAYFFSKIRNYDN